VLLSDSVHGRRPELARPLRSAFYFSTVAVVAFTAWQVVQSCVNVPFWDDFDAYLYYLIRIQDAPDFWSRLAITSEFNNEHVTFTSRFAVWMGSEIFGGIDFRVLGLVSAAMLLPIAAMLTLNLRDRDDRAPAIFFAGVFLFNLQHYENLFWGGSSVDHFGVVLFSVGSLWFLHRPGAWSFAASVLCACLATFTLAHGMLVFPVGLVVLVVAKRWREAAIWTAICLVAAGGWIGAYEMRPGHRVFHPSIYGAWELLRYWLGMLGAPVSFGVRSAAPWLGVGVVALVVAAWRLGALRRHPFHASVLLFVAGATAMIAIGRVGLLGPTQYMGSRYRILACIAVATLGWMLWREVGRFRGGRTAQLVVAALCVAFAIEKASSNAWRGPAYRDRRFIAAHDYAAKHTLAGSHVRLYYDIPKADAILAECARRDIYDLAEVGENSPKVAELPRPVLGGQTPDATETH
jgi:hypothetical protein